MAGVKGSRRRVDFQDLSGQRFGFLFVQRVADRDVCREHGTTMFHCLCDCGKQVLMARQSIRQAISPSCGCQRFRSNRTLKHGMSDTRTYHVWCGIIQRTTNERHPAYKDYGARGITICEHWRLFVNFVADMGECHPGMTIERVNNDLGYGPDNCIWATMTTQNRNKRSNRRFEYDGKTRSIAEISELTGIPHKRLWNRLVLLGWTMERTLTAPVGNNRGRSRHEHAQNLQNQRKQNLQ